MGGIPIWTGWLLVFRGTQYALISLKTLLRLRKQLLCEIQPEKGSDTCAAGKFNCNSGECSYLYQPKCTICPIIQEFQTFVSVQWTKPVILWALNSRRSCTEQFDFQLSPHCEVHTHTVQSSFIKYLLLCQTTCLLCAGLWNTTARKALVSPGREKWILNCHNSGKQELYGKPPQLCQTELGAACTQVGHFTLVRLFWS